MNECGVFVCLFYKVNVTQAPSVQKPTRLPSRMNVARGSSLVPVPKGRRAQVLPAPDSATVPS